MIDSASVLGFCCCFLVVACVVVEFGCHAGVLFCSLCFWCCFERVLGRVPWVVLVTGCVHHTPLLWSRRSS